MSTPVVYLGMPGYGHITAGAARGLFRASAGKVRTCISYHEGSLLAQNFNALWCFALNAEAEGKPKPDYFAMLHADIQPEEYWLDAMVDELERCNLDVLSAIVPMKDSHGLTSTAIDNPADPWKPLCRVTMQEAYKLPETFMAADIGFPDNALLVNTGCWICKFDPEWAKKLHFEINDRIRFDAKKGRYLPEVQPEDWNASRRFHELGLRVGATRKIGVLHRGEQNYTNTQAWGDFKFDMNYTDKPLIRVEEKTEQIQKGWTFPADVDGWLTEKEGRELANLADGKKVLEIGSYCGKSTICMAQTAKEITAVDPFDGRATPRPRDTLQEFKSNLFRYGINGSVKPITGTADEVGPLLKPDYDVVFIDGAHDAQSVRSDIRWARRLVKPGGRIAFHDYQKLGDEGVTKAVDEYLAEGGVLLGTHDSLAITEPH